MGALRLARLSLGQRLLLALGAMLLPLVALGVVGLIALHAADHDMDAITSAFTAKSRALTDVRKDLSGVELSAVRYVESGDRRARSGFFRQARDLDRRLRRLERSSRGPERALARRTSGFWRRAYAAAAPIIARRAPPRPAVGVYPLGSFHPQIERAVGTLEGLTETARRAAVAATNSSNSREERVFAGFLAIFALGVGPAAFIGSRIHRSIHRPAARLQEAAERVGAGDHLARVSLEPGEELGELASAFNVMVEKVAASEEMLRRASKQDAIGQLASGIAHDFNNLLVVMLNSAHFVEAALPEGDPARADVKEIRRAAERATALTRQLLSFSRPVSPRREVLDLSAVVRDMHPLLVRSIGEHIELEIHLADGLPTVKGDPAELEQVVLNLALNSRDAMSEGGRLTIATAAAESPSPGDTPRVRLRVTDSGYGMTAATAARALEPLFTTKPPGEGTGLGLATVDRIVRGMGGRLELSTAPGRGTQVTVELPVAPETSWRPESGEPRPTANGGETILLVEDDDAVRALVRRILSRAGYVVLETAHPAEALRLAGQESQRIDLVVSDVVMPGMSGPAMVERMKHAGIELPVLFLSGYPDSVVSVRRIRVHGFPLLEKPFDPEGLERRVREALDRPRVTASHAALGIPRPIQ